MPLTIVMQGGYLNYTPLCVLPYLSSSLVDQVIYSSWVGSELDIEHPKLTKFYSEPVHGGAGNRNLQILSTKVGLRLVESDLVMKVRSDQIFTEEAIAELIGFTESYIINKEQKEVLALCNMDSPIFVLGNYKNYPYHPKDFIFLGKTQYVQDMFENIPYDIDAPMDYNRVMRAESWLGGHYLARFFPEIRKHMDSPLEYMVDNAPKLTESLTMSDKVTDKVFQHTPAIDFAFPKHNLTHYHYDLCRSMGQYNY